MITANKVMAVFGYNNTRSYDVAKIREMVRFRVGAELLLIKEGVVDADRELATFCLDHPPEDPKVVGALREFLVERELQLVGCLPFSDKGVLGAAHAARAFGLVGDDLETAAAMLNKALFRKLEGTLAVSSELYKKPGYRVATERAEVESFFQEYGAFFLKPTSEGNSRGCMKISSFEDLDRWFVDHLDLLSRGVICEELLGLSDEYSFDGVAGNYWITQKFTTSGAYRAEYQHILPAPLSSDRYASVLELFSDITRGLGSRGGAFHHEFFLLPDGRVASVEPNRRPAGMWIWDLASWAFDGFDPWTAWIDHCAGSGGAASLPALQNYAGVRGVISHKGGILRDIPVSVIEAGLSERFGKDEFRLSVLKRPGDVVRDTPRDNSDFLAFVALRDPDAGQLQRKLAEAEQLILSKIMVRQ